jgi:ubiquinone/menaquinone biosynthesis C-methylase UbiE
MNNLVKQDCDKLKLFKKYGYDMPKARQLILNKAKFNKTRILEVGTGKGHMAIALAKKGFRLTSIDLDRKAQAIAKASLKLLKINKLVTLKVMNAEKLKYGNNFFDSVISVNFMHHAKNPVKCLREMIRVTKNKLVIVDINKRGEQIMAKVHALEGHHHGVSRMSLLSVKKYLQKEGLLVKVYRDVCQTIIIAKKGVVR